MRPFTRPLGLPFCQLLRMATFILLGTVTTLPVAAGPIRDALKERRAERRRNAWAEEFDSASKKPLPEGVTRKADLAYGPDDQQRIDVYLPATAGAMAPIIFMVHGGAWKYGDKRMAGVIENKIHRWVARGFVFVSVNYRLLPVANPQQQVEDVARALAYVQQHALEWQGDPARVILMGHSAGAHLVALVSTHPDLAARQGAKPWLGTVSLDSAAYDIAAIMQERHFKFYDEAFGKDPAFWRSVSPYHVFTKPGRPILAVCSSRREDSTEQAEKFVAHARKIGSPVTLLTEDLSHKEINQLLGQPGAYTEAVEAFLCTLDPKVATMLGQRGDDTPARSNPGQ